MQRSFVAYLKNRLSAGRLLASGLLLPVCLGLALPAAEAQAGPRADPLSASALQLEQAQVRFQKGKELFDAARFGEALIEFDASIAIVASPNAELYRARCLRSLKRTVEAYVAFGRTAVTAAELAKLDARYARAADAASVERNELLPQLGFVKVTVRNPRAGTQLFINGQLISRTAWGDPAVVKAGSVELVLSTPGRGRHAKRVRVGAGATREAHLDAGGAER